MSSSLSISRLHLVFGTFGFSANSRVGVTSMISSPSSSLLIMRFLFVRTFPGIDGSREGDGKDAIRPICFGTLDMTTSKFSILDLDKVSTTLSHTSLKCDSVLFECSPSHRRRFARKVLIVCFSDGKHIFIRSLFSLLCCPADVR